MIEKFYVFAQTIIENDFALKGLVLFLQFLICNLKLLGKKSEAAIEKNHIVNNYYNNGNGNMIINNK